MRRAAASSSCVRHSGGVSTADLLLALDLLGTFAFALNGAFTAVRAVRLDIVGVLALGIVTAIGGGLVRDVLIGAVPPAAFQRWPYLAVSTAGALIAFFVARPSRLLLRPIIVLDAVGLAFFCVAGAQKSLEYGLAPAAAIILGVITAVGGGTIRDMLIGQVPSILTNDLYAIPALAGATIAVVVAPAEIFAVPTAVIAAAVCFVIRMVGVKYKVNAPLPPRLLREDGE